MKIIMLIALITLFEGCSNSGTTRQEVVAQFKDLLFVSAAPAVKLLKQSTSPQVVASALVVERQPRIQGLDYTTAHDCHAVPNGNVECF